MPLTQVGEAGPWRQIFSDISAELQLFNVDPSSHASSSPLLIPCANNMAKVGENRDKFTLRTATGVTSPLFEMLVWIFCGGCFNL